jgi:hypothetical protein
MTDILNKFGEYTNRVNELPTINVSKQFYQYPYYSLCCNWDIPLYIATIKFEELENIYKSANFALIKGSHNKHEGISSPDNNKTAILWTRFEFLKNAIIWYNSCYDYLLLIIYFAFEFSKPKINTRQNYENELKDIKWNKKSTKGFYVAFSKISEYDNYAKVLFDKYNNFYSNSSIRDWANSLKHRGGLILKDLCSERLSFAVINDDNSRFESSYVDTTTVSMKEILDKLIEEDQKIVEFTNYLFDFIGFNEVPNMKELTDRINKKFSAR